MNLILLPGNSKSNKEWIETVETSLKPDFQSTTIQYYEHWKKGGELIDLDKELDKLVSLCGGLDDYIIFAKSAGSLLAIYGIKEKLINPQKCIYAGTAVLWGRGYNFNVDNWLKEYSVPTLFIQQTSDPAMSFSELKELLTSLNVQNYRLAEVPGSDHSYENISQLKNLTLGFLGINRTPEVR